MTEDEFLAIVRITDPDAYFDDHPNFGRILHTTSMQADTVMMLNLENIHIGGIAVEEEQ